MFRILQAILFVMQLLMSAAQSAFEVFDWSVRTAGKLADSAIDIVTGPFRGGPAAAPPVKDLKMALPTVEAITQARDLAKGEGKAAEIINRQSPAQQAQVFASMSEDDRMSADLSLLSDVQVDWLNGLSEGQLRVVAEASERRVSAALEGEPNALVAIRSVGESESEPETALAARIAAFRAGRPAVDRPVAFAIH